jgi:glucan phosphorylase
LDFDAYLKATHTAINLYYNSPDKLTSQQIKQISALGQLSSDREVEQIANLTSAIRVATPKGSPVQVSHPVFPIP